MKWLGQCLAADLLIFKYIASAAKEICSFELRHFINPERYRKLRQRLLGIYTESKSILIFYSLNKYFVLFVFFLTSCSHNGSNHSNGIYDSEVDNKQLEIHVELLKEYWVPYERELNYEPAIKPVRQKRYDVIISITNISVNEISFWTMYGSWFENFQINNEYISFYFVDPIDRNAPYLRKIQPKESFTYKTSLNREISYDNPDKEAIGAKYDGKLVPETKIGFLFISGEECKDGPKYFTIMRDKSKWNELLWSNALYLNN